MRLAIAAVVALAFAAPAHAQDTPVRRAPPRHETLPVPPAMPAPASSGFVESAGARIYYATFGTGAPVILLHGGMGNGDHWAFQVPALAARFQVIAIDSRGQGRSTRTKAPATYDLMATDVIAVMDHLKLAKAALVGWSDGGEVALKLAIHHPDRVTKLFIFGAAHEHGSKPRRKQPASTFARYTARCRADYEKLSTTPKQWRALVQWLVPMWREPMGFSSTQLAAIQAPTVVALGAHDEIIARAQVEELVTLIPHARLVVFDDTSHFAHWQDPTTFNKALVEFLVPPRGK